MSTSSSKPSLVSKPSSPEVKSQEAVGEPVHADKPQVGTTQAMLAAAPVKETSLNLLLEELAAPVAARRAAAATALGRTADVAALPALIAALADSDADVARDAATSLGLLGSTAAVEKLIEVLDDRDGYFHSVVRVAAIQSLGQLRDVRAVEPLLNAIKDPIAEASAEAIRALATSPDPRTLPALLEVVRNEHGFFLNTTRRAAILGLAQIGGAQAACELAFVAENQWEDAVVRAAAIEASRNGLVASHTN